VPCHNYLPLVDNDGTDGHVVVTLRRQGLLDGEEHPHIMWLTRSICGDGIGVAGRC
jgi:hypothetical protein